MWGIPRQCDSDYGEAICPICKKKFRKKRPIHRFCTSACRNKNHSPRKDKLKVCKKCGALYHNVNNEYRSLCKKCEYENANNFIQKLKDKIVTNCFECKNAYADKCIKIKTGSKKFVPGSVVEEGRLIKCPKFEKDK
jgi:hypothetical protein